MWSAIRSVQGAFVKGFKPRWLACSQGIALALLLSQAGCSKKSGDERRAPTKNNRPPDHRVDARPAPMAQPVPLWENGKMVRQVDAATADLHGYVLLDLGDDWTPYIFTERGSPTEPVVPHPYRATYLALANGKFPKDLHGDRARRDKYLELYGIAPTLSLLRRRFVETQQMNCAQSQDLTPFMNFDGFISYQNNDQARMMANHVPYLKRQVDEILQRTKVNDLASLDLAALPVKDQRYIREYQRLEPRYRIAIAVQERLNCEGFLKGKGPYMRGGLDWATHEALAEFERRHRVYGWGYIGKETLEKLRQRPIDLEQQAVLRVLTERAVHSAGVIEDGSTSVDGKGIARTFTGGDGKPHPIPNLQQELERRLVQAFGLQSPEATFAWLQGLGDLSASPGKSHLVAFKGPELPEYYDGDMDLSVVIDRGDVWYEFPYDDKGEEVPQPVTRRPRLTIFTRYLNQKIPLARFGTTIGGWRGELIDGHVMWKYKGSPYGPVVWHQIVSAPVWLPPEGTPPRDIMQRVPGKKGAEAWEISYDDMGPSYASAYGLVAAYHLRYYQARDGALRFGGDEGIRTHGSVDYMSIMRRHSHGCHRLHNHLAVRLMSFVLAHRPHQRRGAQKVALARNLVHEGYTYPLLLTQGGYEFDLDRPIFVDVLEGQILGKQKVPVGNVVPKYDKDAGAYVIPDAGPATVDFRGRVQPIAPVIAADAGFSPGTTVGPNGLIQPPPRQGTDQFWPAPTSAPVKGGGLRWPD